MTRTLRLGIATVALVAAAALAQPAGQPPADPYMGDWQGTVTIDGKEQTVAVYMIPHGDGRYEAKVVSEFDKRVPTLHLVRGLLRDNEFKVVDAVPFDVGRVLGTTDDGVVVDASMWTGKLAGDSVTGTIAGKAKGTFKLSQTRRTSPTLGEKPPAGAVVLFDGSNVDAWQDAGNKGDAKWQLVEGDAMQVRGGTIITKQQFGDFRLHVEFRTPYMPTARGQGRGNSGVYVHGRYEVQVLDSYGLEGADNECGGIYKVARPAVNMCYPPLQWQTYDITFRAARFDAQGKKTENARITVVHNGVTIHDDIELPKPTPGGVSDKDAAQGGILLQNHGNPVRFRNIWIEKLD